MNDKEIYKIWAPLTSPWYPWVRPLLFIGIDKVNSKLNHRIQPIHYTLDKDTAIFIDLPGSDAILEGLALAQKNRRPIPLYNGTLAQENAMALVDNHSIQETLRWATDLLKTIQISDSALPAFLLDTNRLVRHKMTPAVFDNSWDLYDQDIPSAEFFLKQGITKIWVRSDKIHRDLKKIFYKFQNKGIAIYLHDGFNEPKLIDIPKPPKKDKFH